MRTDAGLVESVAVVTGHVVVVVLDDQVSWAEALGLAAAMADVVGWVLPLLPEGLCFAHVPIGVDEAQVVCKHHMPLTRVGDEPNLGVAFLNHYGVDGVVLTEDELVGVAVLVEGVVAQPAGVLIVVEVVAKPLVGALKHFVIHLFDVEKD